MVSSPVAQNAELQTETRGGLTTINAPGLSVSLSFPEVQHHVQADAVTVWMGSPRFPGGVDRDRGGALAAALSRHSTFDVAGLGGRYLFLHFDLAGRTLTAATDRFAVHPLCYSVQGTQVYLSDRADAVPLPESPDSERAGNLRLRVLSCHSRAAARSFARFDDCRRRES